MKWSQLTCMVMILVSLAAVASGAEKEVLSYRTFIDYAKQGKVKSVVVSGYGVDAINATIEKDGGETTFSVKKPFNVGEDALLLDFLTEHNIPHEILDRDMQSPRFMWAAMLPALLMFAVPGLMLVLMVILAFLTLSKISHVERMVESDKGK